MSCFATPTPFMTPSIKYSISLGDAHTCASTAITNTRCWGDNFWGQLGNGTRDGSTTPVAPSANYILDLPRITLGGAYSCVFTSANSVQCWGNNDHGQVGAGSIGVSGLMPTQVTGLSGIPAKISAGSQHTCLLSTAGAVSCWGSNQSGQLGNGSYVDSLNPVTPTGLGSGILSIAIGGEHSCALNSSNQVLCWGANLAGQLASANPSSVNIPTLVSLPAGTVADVFAGYDHSCALYDDNSLYCWGANTAGEIEFSYGSLVSTPVQIQGLDNDLKDLVIGEQHMCALFDSGRVKCWGSNLLGQIANSGPHSIAPGYVKNMGSPFIAIGAGQRHSCAITLAGQVYCWGDNFYGQLGDGTYMPSSGLKVVSFEN